MSNLDSGGLNCSTGGGLIFSQQSSGGASRPHAYIWDPFRNCQAGSRPQLNTSLSSPQCSHHFHLLPGQCPPRPADNQTDYRLSRPCFSSFPQQISLSSFQKFVSPLHQGGHFVSASPQVQKCHHHQNSQTQHSKALSHCLACSSPVQFASSPSLLPLPSSTPQVEENHRSVQQHSYSLSAQISSLSFPKVEVDHKTHPPQQHPNPFPRQNFPCSSEKFALSQLSSSKPVQLQSVSHLNLPSKCYQQCESEENHNHDLEQRRESNNFLKTSPLPAWQALQYAYQPTPAEDPFKNSRSLRHQQPANPRRKGDDDYSDEQAHDDEEESENDEEPSVDDHAVREERFYAALLPKVKQLIAELGVTATWTLDKDEKTCMVCTFPVRLKGWKALLQHAESFQKRKPIQHRAYFRALSEQLKQGIRKAPESNFKGKAVLIESGKATEDVMVWPPVVIIDNMKTKENLDRYVPNIKPSDVQRVIRFSNKGNPALGRMLIVFPASEVGHLNSKMLIDSLAKLTTTSALTPALHAIPPHIHGPAPLLSPPHNVHGQIQSFDLRVVAGTPGPRNRQYTAAAQLWPSPAHMDPGSALWTQQRQKCVTAWQQQHVQEELPKGFMARASDMEMMDPHRKLVKWSVEKKREILKCVLKKSKEEHELGKAKVKAKLVEVDHIAESHQQFKSRKGILSQQLRDAEMALQVQKKREEQIARQHSHQLQMMDEKFKQEVLTLEVERIKREGKIRRLLDENEKQLEVERVARNKEVDVLTKHLENVHQQLRNQTTQKAFEKEREIARRRGEINTEIKLREAQFNDEIRHLERDLVEKHDAEKIKFLEEYNKMRQEFLDEWVTKQATLKEKADNAKREKERLMKAAESKEAAAKEALEEFAECSICFADFDESTRRALIQPCGHAKLCLQCALDIFGKSRLCPICRVKMTIKPKVIPAKLYL